MKKKKKGNNWMLTLKLEEIRFWKNSRPFFFFFNYKYYYFFCNSYKRQDIGLKIRISKLFNVRIERYLKFAFFRFFYIV